jgi:TrmH family RNA methyltransferase
MLSKAQEKLIKSTHTKSGREKSGLILVEGEKLIKEAGDLVELIFDENDSTNFDKLVTTVTPQIKAALAQLPKWSLNDCMKKKTVVVLDNVQDPGNLGTIIRSALAFDAGLVLVECVDCGNPKVIRSSVGAMFHVPWIEMKRNDAEMWLESKPREIYRLELAPNAINISKLPNKPVIIVAGSEGRGITLDVPSPSVKITHNSKLESLNVAVAVSLTLYERG